MKNKGIKGASHEMIERAHTRNRLSRCPLVAQDTTFHLTSTVTTSNSRPTHSTQGPCKDPKRGQ